MTTTNQSADDSINFSDYFHIIGKSWLLAVIIFIVILGAAYAYTTTAPKIYQARSLVLVTSQDQSSLLLGQSIAPKTDIETQKEIIMSSSVMGPVYFSMGMSEFNVIVNSIKNSNVIEIIVESTSPGDAMKAANGIVISYVNYTREAKQEEAQEVNLFIYQQIAAYKSELDQLNLQAIAYENKKKTTNVTSDEEMAYQSLKQAIAAKEKLYDYLLERGEEIGIMAKEGLGNIKIIEYASLPQEPVRPNFWLNMAFGVILAFIGGIGAAFLRYTSIRTFRSINEVEEGMGHSVIGTIPRLKHSQLTAPKGKSSFIWFVETLFTKPGVFFRDIFGPKVKGDYFILDYSPTGPFADNIRMLRTNILFNLKEKDAKLIAVTSPEDKEGKSTIASNLALDFVYAGKKVLLVDANLRNPRLDQVFKIKSDEKGLSDIILGDAKINDVIRKTSFKNLFIITAGQHREFSNELLSSEAIRELCSKLKSSTADIVIIDNSSLQHAESITIAGHSQAVLLVAAHDKTPRDSAFKAKNVLKKVKADVVGIVINFYSQ
ncbi:polysaccharide biosynthesis tyrosine autokinase [Candidatus Woesearchaeota archaeon]|nr:polysaccharide biosynthesis tyrosine autokinase [Candidatus Woesearchaeota archaeon]